MKKENVESRPYDDDSSDARPSFAETLTPPPLQGTVAFNLLNPSPDEALQQNPRAKREIARSSQDNLVACAGNTAELPDMSVPPPFTPSGQKPGEGARTKASSTVKSQEESQMETDAPTAPTVSVRPPVPLPTPAKDKVSNVPCLVDEAGMKTWSNMMLKGHPSGRATTWEQWGNSFSNQFKCVVDTMAQSLRIKVDSYIKMFADKEKAIERVKYLEGKHSDMGKSLIVSESNLKKVEAENKFLKEKLKISQEKLNKEKEANINLFSTIKMSQTSLQDVSLCSTDEERKFFLSGANCIELLDPVPPKENTVYCIDILPDMVPLYRPDGMLFMKTGHDDENVH